MNDHDWAVSLHDVAPDTWPACEQVLALLRPFDVPVTLLVTPHYHRRQRADSVPGFAAALRARVAHGDEVVLHGYSHLDDGPTPRTLRDWVDRRLLTASEGEFAALDAAEARRRLEAGARMVARMGLAPAGFVAPAWLLGAGGREALASTSLRYTSTRDALHSLPSFAPIRAPSLVYSTRTAWRRGFSREWNRRRLVRLANEPRIRAALHPAEASFPEVLAEWRELLTALHSRRRPVLESAWLPAAAGGRPAATAV